MNFQKTNNKSIEQAFQEFDKDNPKVWALFCKYALVWIEAQSEHRRKGFEKIIRISSKQIIGRIRWFVSVETTAEDYKINDAFTPYYARKFIKRFPEYKDVFELREIRTKKQLTLFKVG